MDFVDAGVERVGPAMKEEYPGQRAGESDGGVERRAVAAVVDRDDALEVRELSCERRQIAEVRRDANGGEAGAGRLDACDERKEVVDGVGAPCVGVGAGVAGDLGPGGEVEREELAPWGE